MKAIKILAMLVLLGPFAALAQQAGTCVSPGPCPEVLPNFKHVKLKLIDCPLGFWEDDFYFTGEVPLGVVPLAGEKGYNQTQQCEMLRDALTGAAPF